VRPGLPCVFFADPGGVKLGLVIQDPAHADYKPLELAGLSLLAGAVAFLFGAFVAGEVVPPADAAIDITALGF
jgi:hypothetical protein